MKWSITAKIAVFTAITLILLAYIGALVYQRSLEQIAVGKTLACSQKILTELEAAWSIVKDLEIQERSYAITNSANSAKAISADVVKVDQELNELSHWLKNDPNRAQYIPQLSELIRQRAQIANDATSLSPKNGDSALFQSLNWQKEASLTEKIHQSIVVLQAKEKLDSGSREAIFEKMSQTAIRDLTRLMLLAFAMLIAIFVVVVLHERERAKQEEILRAIGLKFSGVFNQSSETIFLLDPQGKILQTNETALRLVGANQEEVSGLPLWETKWWHDAFDQKERLKQSVVQAAHGAVIRFEARYQIADGSLVDIDFSLKPLKDDQGRTVFLIAEGHELTDFKRAERVVKESESRLRAIFANMGEGLYQLDAEGKLVYLNPAGAKMLGYEMENILGCNMHDLIHCRLPDGSVHAASDCMILNVIKDGTPYSTGDDFFLRNDGSFLPVRILSSPLLVEGQIRGAVVSFEDVTALKQAEKRSTAQYSVTRALAQSESVQEAASRIIESICVNIGWAVGAMWLLDESTKTLRFVQMWHNGTINMEGFEDECRAQDQTHQLSSHENAFSENAPLWISRNDRENSPYFLSAAAKIGLNTAFAFPIRNEDNCIGVIELYSVEVQEPRLELLHMLDALGRQFGQFIERKRVERRLKESEELFSQLADNIREVFWVATPKMDKCLFISPAYKEVWGFSEEEIASNPAAYLRSVVKEDLPSVLDHVKAENMGASGSGIEYRMIGADGEMRWIWSRAFPIKDDNGNVVRLCGIAHDITERKEVEKRVSEFYSTVSHELRTPLTSIRASLGLIEGGLAGEISAKTAQLIQIARSESDRLIRLINDILDIRKIEAGRLELKREDVLPAKLVDISIDSVRAMAAEAGVNLVEKTEHTEGAEGVLCDRDRIVQVLTNLLSNAIKFSPRDSTVSVAVERLDYAFKFSVTDFGSGIAEDQLPKLFGLFQQLDSSDSRPKGGTGLGLAISKAIVEEHGGKIGVESLKQKGSVFWFELPAPSLNNSQPVLTGEPIASKILLVAEDAQLNQLFRVLLAHEGYEALVALDLEEASRQVLRIKPEVIILDFQLPGGHCLEWLTKQRQSIAIENVPVIVLTSSTSDLQRFKQVSLTEWICKPFDRKQLLDALRKAVHKSADVHSDMIIVDENREARSISRPR